MPSRSPLLLLSSVSSVLICVLGRKDVTIESFKKEPSHVWFALNDPVMGGQSTGTFVLDDDNGVGVFEGKVEDVPSLSAPGFITMRTGRHGFFPDIRSCDGLKLRVRSSVPYFGYRLSFGTNFAGSMPYAHGYKARFDVPDVPSEYHDVVLKFTEFSDNWDPKTGDIVISCTDNEQYCPDDETLQNMEQMEIMAEGVKGDVNLEIESILATNCDDDVSETDPDPEDTANRGGDRAGGNRGGGRGQFGNRSYSGYLDRDQNSVGGDGGYMYPTILPNGDIRIESFDNPKHRWYPINDPVMGGSSTSTVTVENEAGVFDGEVVDVSFLDAPGFIKMESRGGNFPDVSMCKALKINLKSMNDYTGIRVTFGTHHADDAQPYIRGYKAHLTGAPVNTFGEVIVPFADFSDKWDPTTGDVSVSCQEDSKHCVDERTLVDFTTFSFMGEGVDGKVHLEVKSIDATECTHSKEEYQSVNAAYAGGEGALSAFAVSGIAVGFLMGGALAFFVGRHYERKSSYIERLDVESIETGGGISLTRAPALEVVDHDRNVIS